MIVYIHVRQSIKTKHFYKHHRTFITLLTCKKSQYFNALHWMKCIHIPYLYLNQSKRIDFVVNINKNKHIYINGKRHGSAKEHEHENGISTVTEKKKNTGQTERSKPSAKLTIMKRATIKLI